MDEPRPTTRAYDPSDVLAPIAVRSAAATSAAGTDPFQVGPLGKVYLIWLAGATCEGCTVAATGGTHPRLEQLLTGAIPGVPRIELIHSLLSIESGAEWVHNLVMAERGELGAPTSSHGRARSWTRTPPAMATGWASARIRIAAAR